ncbi:dihydroneopterin aldolase [Candidatus Cyanaurora vandensis]|uniref:dihydroneopterin aldolase n=1 Tax=Candidatus Cyanaurora vandensis TaxID=2714958 RepID=UPI00257D72D5|nr:dihydroneopterin aldolase [Candidatus Cyanaurora vandensis]
MDKILLRHLEFYGYTGVHPEEKRLGQRFRVDLAITLDLKLAGCSDELADTLDYGSLVKAIETVVTQAHFNLIERLAEQVAQVVLAHAQVQSVHVTLTKCHPPVPGNFEVAVVIERERSTGSV